MQRQRAVREADHASSSSTTTTRVGASISRSSSVLKRRRRADDLLGVVQVNRHARARVGVPPTLRSGGQSREHVGPGAGTTDS
jgi:hypothetical protein